MNRYIIKTIHTATIEKVYEIYADTEDEALEVWAEDKASPMSTVVDPDSPEQLESVEEDSEMVDY